MRKVISLVLVIVMLCSTFAGLQITSSAATLPSSGSCGANVTYTFDSTTGLLTISGSGAMTNYSISSDSPFYYQTGIKTIVINSGVTSIGDSAFYGCSGLTSIIIPDSVTSIGERAFGWCNNLIGITMPDLITSIGVSAFCQCYSLTNVTIPDSVTSISDSAFYGCSGLTSIIIPDSVTSIGSYAFYDCRGLTSIAIPNSVTSIDRVAFHGTGVYNNSSNWKNGLLYIDNWLIAAKSNINGNIAIDNGTIGLAGSAFNYCRGLTSITIPDSVTSIGDYAFYNCSGLTSITIPDSITSIGNSTFYGCSGLTSITIPDSVTSIGNNAFSGLSNCKKIIILGKTTSIKNVITELPSGAQLYVCYDSAADTVAQLNNIPVQYIDETCAETGNHIPSEDKYLHKAATCTETGAYYYDCLICGEVAKEEAIPATGHNFTATVTENPTCTETGEKTYTCSNCKSSYTEIIPANGHTWDNGAVTTEPTCTEKGIKTFTCTVCEANRYEDVAALGHIFKIVNHEDGSLNYVYCERSKTETVDASLYPQSEHNYDNNTNKTYNFSLEKATKLVVKFSASTKVENLYDIIYLYNPTGALIGKFTGSALAGKTITVNGDKFSVKLVSDGENTDYGFSIDSIVATISLCDYHETKHTYENIVTEPTCTEKGFTTHTCSDCGNTYKDNIKEALGHNFKKSITKATIGANGKIVSTCVRCGQVQTDVIYYPKTITISKTTFNYNKKVQKPTVKVTGSNGKAIADSNYTVTYSKGCKNVGKYAVKVTFKGNYSGSKTFNYVIRPVVSPTSKALYIGQGVKIKTSASKACTFASANKKIAIVDKKGSVTAKGAGTVKITVKCNGVANAVTIKVVKPSLALNKTSAIIYIKGKLQLKATTKPSGQKVKWSSSNTKVATVNSNGVVVGIKAGKANITATYVYKGKTYKNVCKIVIKNPVLNDSIITLYNGWSYTLSVIGGSGTIKWSSSNKKIATVNSAGKVLGNQMGVCYVYATRNGLKMKCKVTVSPYNKECMYYFAFKYGYSGYGFLDIGAVFGAQPLYSTIRNGSIYYSYNISDLGTAYWRSTFVALLEEEGFYYYQGFYINGSPGEVGTKMIYLTTSNGVVNIQYSIYPF